LTKYLSDMEENLLAGLILGSYIVIGVLAYIIQIIIEYDPKKQIEKDYTMCMVFLSIIWFIFIPALLVGILRLIAKQIHNFAIWMAKKCN